MSEWQPIETAPKDRTRILVLAAKSYSKSTSHMAMRMEVDFWHNTKSDGYNGYGHFNGEFYPATHWMPLPAPPTQEGE